MSWDECQSWRLIVTFHHCFFPQPAIALSLGEKESTHLQWTRNYMVLPEHRPCVLRRLCAASTQSLWVPSPALRGLADLFMRGLGGLAMVENVKHLPMEKQMPTAASFLQDWQEQRGTSQCVTWLYRWHSPGCTLGESAAGPLVHGKCCHWRYNDAVSACDLFHFFKPDS